MKSGKYRFRISGNELHVIENGWATYTKMISSPGLCFELHVYVRDNMRKGRVFDSRFIDSAAAVDRL